MLRKETVEKKTFELLKRLQSETLLKDTILVGGTALSLQIGHRTSIDLDLFTSQQFDTDILTSILITKYNFTPRSLSEYTVLGDIDGVKIDIIYHPFKWLKAPIEEDGVRIAHTDDIIAMKLHAIINSGKRPKDFVDIAYLSQSYSYDRMKELLLEKYPSYDPIMADRAINFFDDINNELIPQIKMIDVNFDFEKIKKRLYKIADHPLEEFSTPPLANPVKKNNIHKPAWKKTKTPR